MSNPVTAVPQPTISEVSARISGGSIWYGIGRVAGKAFASPFRTASTLVNAGVFGAYYVSTVAISGLVLTGSALSAPLRLASDRVTGNNPGKSLSEYVVSPVKKTYNFISRLYNELPDHGSEIIFAGVGILAVGALAIVAVCREGGRGCRGSNFVYIDAGTHHYHNGPESRENGSGGDSYFSRMLRPYKISTNIGVAIMDKTTRLVNGPQTDA